MSGVENNALWPKFNQALDHLVDSRDRFRAALRSRDPAAVESARNNFEKSVVAYNNVADRIDIEDAIEDAPEYGDGDGE
jgi:hypothetical protein